MSEIRILGLYINERVKDSITIQNLLTRYGCSIKTRLGLHEVVNNYCSTSGLIILELCGETSEMDNLEKELNAVKSLQVRKMSFEK